MRGFVHLPLCRAPCRESDVNGKRVRCAIQFLRVQDGVAGVQQVSQSFQHEFISPVCQPLLKFPIASFVGHCVCYD